LRLNNGGPVAYQTLGIQRQISTTEGARYTLSFNYAAGPAFSLASGEIGIYLDGARIATYTNTSPRDGLNWQTVSFEFDGNGQTRELSIQLEGGDAVATSTATIRAANIDALRVVETLPLGADHVYGLVDTEIALPRLEAALLDTDGSEKLDVELSGLPEGTAISDGVRSHTVTATTATLNLSGWNLNQLALQAAVGYTGTLQLRVRATSSEASNSDSASVERTVEVVVLPGRAVATPVGVNPYVTLTSVTTSSPLAKGGSKVATAVLSANSRSVAASSRLAEGETLSPGSAQSLLTPRPPEEEALDEQERRRHSEAWLQTLEKAAKAQWHAQMGAEHADELVS
ncbi:MAG: hypothetical protein OEM00_09990, partial [Burkholderiaceae bacterium]|nr:hypothetical protein [Burkholderiaceae bacterium]